MIVNCFKILVIIFEIFSCFDCRLMFVVITSNELMKWNLKLNQFNIQKDSLIFILQAFGWSKT